MHRVCGTQVGAFLGYKWGDLIYTVCLCVFGACSVGLAVRGFVNSCMTTPLPSWAYVLIIVAVGVPGSIWQVKKWRAKKEAQAQKEKGDGDLSAP